MNQALRAARAATGDEDVHRRVLDALAGIVPNISLGLTPPEITQQGYKLIYQITGNNDPFREAKVEANRAALVLYPRLRKLIANSEDRMLAACKLAIAANSIDLASNFNQIDINEIVKTALTSPLAINDYHEFQSSISNSRHILYLGDNAGEIVFDHLLIEELHHARELEVTFVVRESPIINDATLDDALAVGMDRVATVVSNGSDAPATILSQCSTEMLEYYRSADVIIAKGQGNYESLDREPDNIFFLLRAKCSVLAELLGVQVGDAVLKQQPARGGSK